MATFLLSKSLITSQQTRSFATLKDISIRIKSVKNIQKITKSMKMVAAAKYARAEKELKGARSYGEGTQGFYEHVDVAKKPQHLIVVMSSDRGLCGGVHSGLAKMVKNDLNERDPDQEVKLVCVGDKSKALLQKQFPNEIILTVNNVGKRPPTFQDASEITQSLLDSGFDFKQGDIYFNRFRSVVSYKPQKMPVIAKDAVETSEKLTVYDSLDAEVIQSYMEYSLASLFFYAAKESACSEHSSRMTAMDAASKNAGEMIDKLTLHFNRTRQAVITRELIEIISGAAAL